MSNHTKQISPFPAGWIEKELSWWNIPGVTIGITNREETLFAGGFGLRSLESGQPMTGHTLGAIASCSKSFTSAVIASLCDEGVLDLDTPVRAYVPEFDLMDRGAGEQCTLRDMLYHRTGLAPHDAMWPDPGRSERDFLHALRYLEPNRPFRSSSEYNNTMYAAAGAVAAIAAGKTWEALVHERIFAPLGMQRSTTTVAAMRQDPEQDWAVGYFGRERQGALQAMEPWEMDIAGPAAGVNSCAEDMLRWIRLHMNRGRHEGRSLISEKMMDEMHLEAVRMSAFPWIFPEVPGIGWYGLAWKTCVYRGMEIKYHCGEIEGYCSMEMFLPQQDLGMFVLCNRHKPVTPFLLELVYMAIDSVLGLAPIDWAERLHPYEAVFGGSCDDWKVDLLGDKQVPGTRPARSLHEYCGVYEHPGYGQLTITEGVAEGAAESAAGGSADNAADSSADDAAPAATLYLHYKKWLLPLTHYHYETFKAEDLKEDTLYYTVPVTFHYNDRTGAVDSFSIRLEAAVPPVRFMKQ